MSISLSVIIPSYNRVAVLGRAIESVLQQKSSFDDVELQIIVVDDGSNDDTAKVVAEQFLSVEYYYQKNSGVSAARNFGLSKATNEWVALLDSDDEWLPNKVQNQYQLLKETGLLVCHTQEIWIRDGVRVNQMKKHIKRGGWIFQHCLPLCAMSPSSIMLHRSVFDDVGGFDEFLPACEDYDLWLRIAAQYEVAYLETPSINKYGGHDDQLSRQFWGMDRFRVLALEKILNTQLNDDDYQAAKEMLIKKLKILLTGGVKRNNDKLVAACQKKLAAWEPVDES